MREKELDRLKVLEKVLKGELTQKRASETLQLSLRQVKRLCKRLKEEGSKGLVHRRRGKIGNRQINKEIQKEVLEILATGEFSGYGPTLFQEILMGYKIKVSREWLRKLMITNGHWKSRKVKKISNHSRRKRRSRKGELIQLDGSYENWFEDRGPRCCLLVMIDDATSEIMAMRFVDHETTNNYFSLLREYLVQHGRPLAMYGDRHSVFKVSKEGTGKIFQTQFERAMNELQIEMIHAYSPQAKGRVERVNRTLQDRLIKEMRLYGISTIEDGNKFLEKYIAKHNSRFSVEAEIRENAHAELLSSMNIDKILVTKEERRV